jgi:benzoyl-CoA reductase/2-hydroxyglutaryl-CoA dehydratase subunit BcrC/BadD/HgdB
VSGRRFDNQRFEEMILIARDSSVAWGEVLATMKAQPAPMTIFDAFIHLAPIVSLRGLPVALDYYQILLEELRERIDRGIGAIENERKRLMWDNIAIWYKVRDFSNLFAERGMNFVTATYTNAWAETISHMDADKPFESIARTYSLVVLNNNLNHRLRLMERLIKEYRVDGLVIHSAKSCKPYSVGQYDLKRLLMDRLAIPSVIVDADITDFRAYSEEQTRTRLEAFFETMEG